MGLCTFFLTKTCKNIKISTDFAPVQENVLTKIYGVPSCGPGRIWPNRTVATVMDWNAKKITNDLNWLF